MSNSLSFLLILSGVTSNLSPTTLVILLLNPITDMFLEILALKGLPYVLQHCGPAILHYLVGHATISGLITTAQLTFTASVVAGGIKWTAVKVDSLVEFLEGLETQNPRKIIRGLLGLKGFLDITDPQSLSLSIHDYLVTSGNTEEAADNVAKAVEKFMEEIGDDIQDDAIMKALES